MNEHETIADIIAEMRGMGNYQRYSGDHARVLANRLEAAHKRERGDCAKLREALKAIGGLCAGLMPTWDGAVGRIKDIAETALAAPATSEKSSAVGNAAKLREALVKCREIALQWQADEAAGVAGTTDKPHSRSAAEAVVDMEFEINAALSAPPRNCDVGTAQEQSRRFDQVCSFRFTGNCAGCKNPLDDSAANGVSDCALFWAQMPYEEGGAK